MTTTPRTLSLRLPLPPWALSPNAREHPMAKARAAKAYRERCWGDLREAMGRDFGPPMQQATLRLQFRYCHRQRRWDQDNAIAAFKSGRDGLKDASLVADDSAERLLLAGVTTVKCPKACRCGGAVVVSVEEVL